MEKKQMGKKKYWISLATVFALSAITIPTVTVLLLNKGDGGDKNPMREYFYSLEDKANPPGFYEERALTPYETSFSTDMIPAKQFSFGQDLKYKNPENLVAPLSSGHVGNKYSFHMFLWDSAMLDRENLVTKNIVFNQLKSEKEILIDAYTLPWVHNPEWPEGCFPNLEWVFVGSGITHIGNSALGCSTGQHSYSVWFDHEDISDLKFIDASWYKQQCGAYTDSNIKRIAIRDGQDKDEWSIMLGKPKEIIFWASEISKI